MSQPEDSIETVEETCDRCGEPTEHVISIDLVTESDREQNEEYSREPYRVSECTECGETRKLRMNNA
ncbi:DUF7835 family putative zinc beta-ribbon protein [Halegenticoccus tardaugens]|uniref:DUF7835 family putative zinc beta-ribbon protein n=1 Tax=Halegenticoccus tardaugens TaxID=2071624 RepID=UPI00100C2A35|nr:hypothetical protein [Halegenticoccus tardaugens]